MTSGSETKQSHKPVGKNFERLSQAQGAAFFFGDQTSEKGPACNIWLEL